LRQACSDCAAATAKPRSRHCYGLLGVSREAARAIAAAMPLRVNAKQVLLAALKSAIRRWATDWLIFLASWFGTEAAPTSIFMPSVADPAGEVLMAAARAHHADMLVMGAFGHGRMRKSSSEVLPSQSLNRLKLRSF
jgi:nucleotide-binding universal stress UspA family protein